MAKIITDKNINQKRKFNEKNVTLAAENLMD